MLLTITTTMHPATDLGYLLHKHPERCQRFALTAGAAYVFYPEANAERCTAALLLDIDPVDLARSRGHDGVPLVSHYVNDRPYAASSFLSVAIARVYGTALGGRCEARPDLAAAAQPFAARVVPLPARGGEALIRRLFEPLGYEVTVDPAGGIAESRYADVTLRGEVRLRDLLTHLYVLIPVLDDAKHYWIGADEVDKLLRHGDPWLSSHPERYLIVQRYLRHRRHLTRMALARLTADETDDPDEAAETRADEERAVEAPIRLHQLRLDAVLEVLRAEGARRVLDLGCGGGRLLELLARDPVFTEILGMDVSVRALEQAEERLRRLPDRVRARVQLHQGALTYRDRRLTGWDGAALVEVIEHLDPVRLPAFARAVFALAQPRVVVLTTPNVEYNVRFTGLPAGRFRHRDHRFEWTRAEFQIWAEETAGRYGYAVRCCPVGPVDPEVGPPSQLAVFTREPDPPPTPADTATEGPH